MTPLRVMSSYNLDNVEIAGSDETGTYQPNVLGAFALQHIQAQDIVVSDYVNGVQFSGERLTIGDDVFSISVMSTRCGVCDLSKRGCFEWGDRRLCLDCIFETCLFSHAKRLMKEKQREFEERM